MEFARRTTKTLFALVAFGVLGFWVLENFKAVCSVLGGILAVLPFCSGCGNRVYPQCAQCGRWSAVFQGGQGWKPRFARPVSLLLSLLGVLATIGVVLLVIPEVMRTFRTIGEGIPHSAQFPVPVGQPV